MKTINPNRQQIDKVLEELEGVQGNFDIYVRIDENLTIEAQGYLTRDGYVEDDYFNGTGAFIETSRKADAILTGFLSDAGENEEVVDIEGEIVDEVRQFLEAA